MIYLIHGNDETKAQNQFHKLVAGVHSKRPDAPVFGMVGGEVDLGRLDEVVFGNSLFDAKYIVTLKHFLDDEEGGEWLLTNLKSLAESPHLIFILEKSLTKPQMAQFKKHATDIKEYSKVEEKKDDKFIFTLADTFGDRDRQKLWVVYQEALSRGIPAEEVFWQFVRQVKNMLVVAQTSDVRKVKMHPFVLQKTSRAAKNFSLEELKNLSGQLVKMYDDARNGRREFEVAVERLCLEV